jgi:hypothetical protein
MSSQCQEHAHAAEATDLLAAPEPARAESSTMGSWGVGIFSNDDASDVREGFRDLIAQRLAAAQAAERLMEEYGIGQGGDDDNDFWLGLAATQHKVGHVVPNVLDRALSIIDSPSELERWEPAQRTRRKAALDKLRDQLLQPPPPPKKLRPRPKLETNLEPGQHVLVPVRDRDVLLRVTRIHEDKGGRCPVVVVLDWNSHERRLRKPHRLPAQPNPWPQRADEAMGFILIGERSDPDEIQVLPQVTDGRTPRTRWQSQLLIKWSELEKWFGPDGSPQWPENA